MASLATIAAVATIGSAVIGAGAAVYQGYQSNQAQILAAQQEEKAGKQEFAAAQREADDRRLEGKLIMSKALAAAAASGGGAGFDAPTITKILTDTGQRAEYGAQSAMYQGAARRDDYFNSASSRRSTGQFNFFGGLLKATGTLAGGVGDWAALPT